MGTEIAQFSYQGHEIRLEYRREWGWSHEVRFDGRSVILEGYPANFGSFCRELSFKVKLDGEEKLFSLRIGLVGGFRQKYACQLWVDGEKVGGDQDILFRYKGENSFALFKDHLRFRMPLFVMLGLVAAPSWVVVAYFLESVVSAGLIAGVIFASEPIFEYWLGYGLPKKQKGGA